MEAWDSLELALRTVTGVKVGDVGFCAYSTGRCGFALEVVMFIA